MPSIGKRVLIVDDDEQLVDLVSLRLTQVGFTVDATTKAAEGRTLALQNEYDAIILDVVMPKESGLEICTKLRSAGVLAPIIILSAKTEKEIIVEGLDVGADDYLTKPFSVNELVARLRALLRRSKKTFDMQTLQREDVRLDIPLSVVWLGQTSVALTKKETLLLRRLMSESPRPVPRQMLLQDVWGVSSDHASNRLDVYIRRLRKKLQTAGGEVCIHTVRSGGYYFGKV